MLSELLSWVRCVVVVVLTNTDMCFFLGEVPLFGVETIGDENDGKSINMSTSGHQGASFESVAHSIFSLLLPLCPS